MVKKLLISLIVFILLPAYAFAATYYIDGTGPDSNKGTSKSTPWKYHPGMSQFSGSYTHSPGDIFIFKGGVTWTAASGYYIMKISWSGGSGNPDQYTVDTTWYTGSSWTQPTFNGGAQSHQVGIYANGISNILINNLNIVNVGDSSGSGLAICWDNVSTSPSSNIEIKNCTINANCVDGLYFAPVLGSNFSFHNNYCLNNGRYVLFQGAPGPANTYSDIYLYDNLIQGPSTYNPQGYHLDGFMIGTGPGLLTNVYIYGNKFYGDWSQGASAAIYLNGNPGYNSISRAWIFNNLIVPENNTIASVNAGHPTFSPGAITIYNGYFNDIYIYNNTISCDAYTAVPTTGIFLAYVGTVVVENNIFSGVGPAIIFGSNPGGFQGPFSGDNNQFNVGPLSGIHSDLICDAVNGINYKTCASLRGVVFGHSIGSYGSNYCVNSNPKFVALPSDGVAGSGNFQLQSGSPAVGHGANLTSLDITALDTDYAGNARPPTGAWDIGAYEYVPATGNVYNESVSFTGIGARTSI